MTMTTDNPWAELIAAHNRGDAIRMTVFNHDGTETVVWRNNAARVADGLPLIVVEEPPVDARVAAVRALHVPWYEVQGVRHDFTVIAYGPDRLPPGHECTHACIGYPGSDPEDVEHQVLACSECRGTNPDYDDAVCHPFWPCPTIRALDEAPT